MLGSQPDDENRQPEFLFNQPFKPPPEEVLQDLRPINKGHKLVLKKRLANNANIHRVANMYTMAVYDHIDQGPRMQSQQVFAVLFHELDHKWAEPLQREHYHQYCGKWCRFQEWKSSEKPDDEVYTHDTSNWLHEKDKPWDRGIFAGIDYLYPEAFRVLVTKFRWFGRLELMGRCSMRITTNMAESMHARLHGIATKSCHRSLKRLRFVGLHTMLASALGHLRANLDGVFGTRSARIVQDLNNKQVESFRVASRKHDLDEKCHDGSRLKVSTDPNVSARPAAAPRRQKLIPSTEEDSYVGGGEADLVASQQ